MCASGASTVTAVSSADGDPSPAGEINAIGQVMAADGDPFNEIDQINQAYGMTTRQINHLKELNIYNQFNTVNRYTNVS